MNPALAKAVQSVEDLRLSSISPSSYQSQTDAEQGTRFDVAVGLLEHFLRRQELRRDRGITQDQVAKVLNVRQAAVSKLEGRDDVLLSTLAAYVRALGGTLEVVARFGDRAIRLDPRNATAKARSDSSVARLNRGRKLPMVKGRS
jgi:transcriptional regulator with XRE-family HTH domain